MTQDTRRKCDNGIRKYISPNWMIAIILLIGMIVTFMANVKAIPGLLKTIDNNESRITKVERDITWIRETLTEIKSVLIK